MTDRDNEIRHGARAHVAWVTSTDEWNAALTKAQRLGTSDRRVSLALREYTPSEVASFGPKRASNDYNAARAVLQSVLPPKVAAAVHVLELGIPIAVGAGLAITDPPRVTKLKEACLRRLRGERLTDARRQRLRRDLPLIDPREPSSICARPRPGYAPEVGEAVALHATAAGEGFVLAGPSVAGQPVIGRMRSHEGPYSSRVRVDIFVL